ncbi:MAG: hypothetical protein QF440_04505 [Candidatus Thalassarchaeaceae archaeon]|nr:hypothetical protein [Candidatus Thalassarchaeaceae archaeon]
MEEFEKPTQRGDDEPIIHSNLLLNIKIWNPTESVNWKLPPSKSHIIRWLLLTSQGPKGELFTISGTQGAGLDAISMLKAISKIGVRIEKKYDELVVEAVGINGFRNPMQVINCENSGTTLRLLTIAVTRIGEPITLDGDQTLRKRGSPKFWKELKEVGFRIKHGTDENIFPIVIQGPLIPGAVKLNVSKTSQHLSSLLLSMPAMDGDLQLDIAGELVSREHAALSFELAKKCGSKNILGEKNLKPFNCKPPKNIVIPKDSSHISFAILFQILHGIEVIFPKIKNEDTIGSGIILGLNLQEYNEVNLRDANDLITPLAAIMAIGGGGKITGAHHAQFKESARITSTLKLLTNFGLKVVAHQDGLEIQGEQIPIRPAKYVKTYGDHRCQMTAVILATKVGGKIEGAKLHQISDPNFIANLTEIGVNIKNVRN